jgi:hypothetical protein
LVDQVLLDPRVPSQEVCHKLLGEFRLVVKHAYDGRLFKPRDDAVRHRRGRGQAQWLSGQAALAEKVALAMERDDRLLAPLGYDAELDPALLDIEDGIRRVSLREDLLIVSVVRNVAAAISGVEELFEVEQRGTTLGLRCADCAGLAQASHVSTSHL